MINTDAFALAFRLTGATSKELDARQATVVDLNQITPGTDLHALVEEAVTAELADTTKLNKRLTALAEQNVANTALAEVRKLAGLQAEAQFAGWIATNLDELLDAAGRALQPTLDDFVAKALTLPAEVARHEKFPVREWWTPEQYSTWREIEEIPARLDQILNGIYWAYNGIGAEGASRGVPAAWSRWFAFIDPHDYAGGLQDAVEGRAERRSTYGQGSAQLINQWIALAHLTKGGRLALALAGPTQARRRVQQWLANRAAVAARSTKL